MSRILSAIFGRRAVRGHCGQRPRFSWRVTVLPLVANPLSPIGEPQARAIAEQALIDAEASSNPRIESNAQLAGALSTLLLGTSDPSS